MKTTLSSSGGENPLDYPALRDNPMEFYVVATDALTGEAMYFDKGDIKQDDYIVMKTSSAIPFVCKPYEVLGRPYYDGALGDPVPVEKAFQLGCDRVIVILTKSEHVLRDPKRMREHSTVSTIKAIQTGKRLRTTYIGKGKAMGKIQIMTDSASDISSADEQKYSIEVLPFPVTLGDRTYISRVDFNNEQFFSLMAQYDEIPKTAQVTPFQFQEIYLRQAQAGVTDLILVLINSQGSATYDNSVQAVDLFYEEYPEYRDCFHIHSFDGMGYNALYGSPVVHAARMCVEGASLEEILGYLTDILPRRQIYFGIYDLKYAAKSGRIPTAAAFAGTVLNLKPVMKIFDRSITTAAKCRGERKLVEKVAEMSITDMEPGTPYELIYGDDATCLEELRRLMVQRLGYEPAANYQIGAAVAANSGPRVAGVAFTKKMDK